MARAHWLRTATVLFGLAIPAVAGAQAITPPSEDGAKVVAQNIRDWIAKQFEGTGVDSAALPLKVVPDGETYRLELGFGGSYFNNMLTMSDGAFAATVKPMDDGKWQIVSGAAPSPLRGEMREADGAPASVAEITMGKQDVTGTFDPSLASPSTFTTTILGYSATTRAPAGVQTSMAEKLSGRSEWLPTGPGRVTVQGDTVLEKYSSISPLPSGGELKVTIDRMSGATRMENLDLANLGGVMRSAFTLGTTAKKGDGAANKEKTAEQKSLALAMLAQLAGLLDAMEAEYTYDGIAIDGGAFMGSLRQFGFGLALGADGGKAGMKLRLSAEGLESPMIPDGPIKEFVPHRLTLTPSIGGVPKDVLVAYLKRAIETEGNEMAGEGMALLAQNPVVVGLDDVLIDIGPLRLKGVGAVQVASPEEIAGEAVIRASGLDAMIRRVNTVPDFKGAAPVLIFLKGIGKQEGTETVWKIVYADKRLMVNDTDMSDLMPSK
jgi:hypothetical protein